MGCTPTAIKDKNKIPPINSYPSNVHIGPNQTSLDNIVAAASRLTPREFEEIVRYDLAIKDEKSTPTRVEKIDFINKQYVTAGWTQTYASCFVPSFIIYALFLIRNAYI